MVRTNERYAEYQADGDQVDGPKAVQEAMVGGGGGGSTVDQTVRDAVAAVLGTARSGVVASKCKTNGADESSRFVDEVLAASAAGKVLILPNGTINLSGINSTISVAGLAMAAPYGACLLDAGTAKYVDLIRATGGDVDLYGVGFRRWHRPIISNATLGLFRMRKCVLIENRAHVYLQEHVDNPLSSVDSIVLEQNAVLDSPGWELKSAVGEAICTGNRLKRVRRLLSIWDTSGHNTFGICIGGHDNVAPELSQRLTRKATITGNVVRGMENTSTDGMATNGIIVSAEDVIITGNQVADLDVSGNLEDCEGIYTKSSFGLIANNVLTDATRESCAIAIKGFNGAQSPSADKMSVHHNIVRSVNAVNSIGAIVFASASDVDIYENSFYDLKDGAVNVYGNPKRVHTRRNKAVRCGGIPFYYACGDIKDCGVDGNEIIDQVMSSAADVARVMNPYPDTGTHVASGIHIKAIAGKVADIALLTPGNGYTINGQPDGNCLVKVKGGAGGFGSGAYVVIKNGQIYSLNPTSEGTGWTAAPTVFPLESDQPGTVIACSGIEGTALVTITSGRIDGLSTSNNSFSGVYQSDAAKVTSSYDCVTITNGSATSSAVVVDGIQANISGSNSPAFDITGLNALGQQIATGRADRIRMLGPNTGRRMKPWKSGGSSAMARSSNFGPRFKLFPAQVEQGMIAPQHTLMDNGAGKARCTISFARFTSAANHFMGEILGGQSEGVVRVTKVTPRYVLQGGGSALSAASGAPTVALGTSIGAANLIAATSIASLGTVASPVDGQASNELSAPFDAGLYMTISGGTITPNNSAYLLVDIEYTVWI